MGEFARRWAKESIHLQNEAYFTTLFADICHAQATIDVEMYIFNHDELGQRIIAALLEAADRGVRVRVLVDSVGSAGSSTKLYEVFQNTPIEIRFYHRFFKRGMLNTLTKLNRRNHRKTWVFDGALAHLGSVNISMVHVPKAQGGGGWQDATLRVEGEAVDTIIESFVVAWTKPSVLPGKGRRPSARKLLDQSEGHDGDLVHFNDTTHRRISLRWENKKRLRETTARIWLANPYFAPHRGMIRALRMAAKRGVDVRIIVPKESDVFFMPLLSFTYYKVLLEAGVKIYRYLPAMLHSKIRITDEHYVLGSSSLDYRSLLYNLESDIVVTHEVNQAALQCEVQKYIANSETITLATIENTPWYIRWLSSVFSLIKYWA